MGHNMFTFFCVDSQKWKKPRGCCGSTLWITHQSFRKTQSHIQTFPHFPRKSILKHVLIKFPFNGFFSDFTKNFTYKVKTQEDSRTFYLCWTLSRWQSLSRFWKISNYKWSNIYQRFLKYLILITNYEMVKRSVLAFSFRVKTEMTISQEALVSIIIK